MIALLESKPIVSGILGAATGFGASFTAFFAAANLFLAFVAGLFGAATAVLTFILVLRKVQVGRRRRALSMRRMKNTVRVYDRLKN